MRHGGPPRPGAAGAISAALLVGCLAVACGTARGVSALRDADFELDRITGVRLAGIPLDGATSIEDIGPGEGALIAAGALAGTLPLAFDVLVRASNPASNRTAAELLRMDWTLLLDGRSTLGGAVDRRYTIPPGGSVLVPVHVAVDLADVLRRQTGTLLRLALALAGEGRSPVSVGLRVVPILDTPLGGLGTVPVTIPLDPIGG